MSQYLYVFTEMQTCKRSSPPKQFSQLVFTFTGEWWSTSVIILCDVRKSVVSCLQERYVSVSFIAIVCILCASGFRAVSFEF